MGCDKVIEGKPLSGNLWDFSFNTWNLPFFVRVGIPDGVTFHSDWKPEPDYDPIPIAEHFASTREEAEKIIANWDHASRIKYVSRKAVFWSHLSEAYYRRGWLTPNGRRRFRRADDKKGAPFGALALEESDLRQGLTFEWVDRMGLWRSSGPSLVKDKILWKDWDSPPEVLKHHEETCKIREAFRSPECPVVLRKWYIDFNGEEGDGLPELKR